MTDGSHTPAIRARLSVLFAAAAPKAVILRRGPKTHWHLIAWDLATDTFTHGQWMKGLVRLCDLSPKGDKLIYWAAQHHRSATVERPLQRVGPYDPLRVMPAGKAQRGRKVPRYLAQPAGLRRSPHPVRGTWTAISTPPYFTALAIWPAFGHWIGGGLFLGERELWVREPQDRMVPIERVAIPSSIRLRSLHSPTGWTAAWKGSAIRASHGENLQSGEMWDGLTRAGATWVEWVHARSETELLFACDGRVYRLQGWREMPADRYLKKATLLVDLTDLRFEMRSAPAEALRW